MEEFSKSSKVYAVHLHILHSPMFSFSFAFFLRISMLRCCSVLLSFSYGARLTGGGWGGSCFALTNDFFTEREAELIAQAYYDRFKNRCKYYKVSAAQGTYVYSI